jgi:uncharacterized iron-regulated membrane protein
MAELNLPKDRRRVRRLAWPRVPAAFVREALAGHSALGLAVGGLIYLVCVTGTLDVFVSELRTWERPRPPVAMSAGFIDRALAEAQQRAGKGGTAYLMLPPMEAGRARLETYSGGREASYALGAHGEVLDELNTPFTDFVDRMHMYLSLPATVGLILVGLTGAALLSLLLSGLLAHPRIFRDAFTLRWGGSKRLQEADLHNRLSVWGLPFHLAVTLTGAFFGLSNLLLLAVALAAHHGDTAEISALVDGPAAVRDERPTPLPAIGPILQRLGVSADLGRINYIGVQGVGTRGAQISLELSVPGRLLRGERQFFDASGRYQGSGGYADGPLGKQAYAAAASLHFGAFGGLPVRLAYGALGFALCVVCSSGLSIWVARRRDQARPAPRTERLWLGTVWGVLVGLAGAAIVALTSGISPLMGFWAAGLATATAALAQSDAREASRLGRGALAAGLVGAALVHLVRFRMVLDLNAAIIDSLCLFTAIGLGASLRRGPDAPPERKRPPSVPT